MGPKTKSQRCLLKQFDEPPFKDVSEEDVDSMNEPSFSFSSSEFLSLEQQDENEVESSENSSSSEDAEEDHSSVSSLQFKSMSTHLLKRFRESTKQPEKRVSDPPILDEKGRSLSVQPQNSIQKNIKTHKFLTGSNHSNDAFDHFFGSNLFFNNTLQRMKQLEQQSKDLLGFQSKAERKRKVLSLNFKKETQ